MCSDMQNGDTALICAAASGRCHVVTELISLGAGVDFQNNVSSVIGFCLTMILSYCSGPLHAQFNYLHSLETWKCLCKLFIKLP